VIDGAADSVIATVDVGAAPYAFCYNATNNKVYCANSNNRYIAVIDGATNSVIALLAAGSYPRALCYNGTNNKVYCANQGNASVTVIDGAADVVLSTIWVGKGPLDFAWNPVQNRVYVANYDGSSVSVLRDSGGAAVEESPKPQAASSKPLPTIIRGVLYVPRDMGAGHNPIPLGESGLCPNPLLLDISGRKVLDLRPGANDVRALAPGVYFVREAQAQAQAQAVRKVVVTR
jgi:YVTN family beta-propeller protein